MAPVQDDQPRVEAAWSITGYLRKRNTKKASFLLKNWNKRWFALDNRALVYSISPKDKIPKHAFPVEDILEVRLVDDPPSKWNPSFEFEVTLPGRTLRLRHKSDSQRQHWVAALQRARSISAGSSEESDPLKGSSRHILSRELDRRLDHSLDKTLETQFSHTLPYKGWMVSALGTFTHVEVIRNHEMLGGPSHHVLRETLENEMMTAQQASDTDSEDALAYSVDRRQHTFKLTKDLPASFDSHKAQRSPGMLVTDYMNELYATEDSGPPRSMIGCSHPLFPSEHAADKPAMSPMHHHNHHLRDPMMNKRRDHTGIGNWWLDSLTDSESGWGQQG